MELELIERGQASSRPTLLFIHGAFHDARCWDVHLMPWFADKGWHSIAVSLRGHGNSPGDIIADDPSLSELMSDIITAIDHINGPVILVGHSMGGAMAELVAPTHDAVKGVIMMAPSPRRPALSVVARLLFTHPILLIKGQFMGDDDALRKVFIESFFEPDMPTADRQAAEAMIGYESRQAMAELFGRPILTPDQIPDVPFLVIGGEGDWSIPKKKLVPVAALHDAPLVMVPGPHDLMFGSKWKVMAQVMLDWLDQQFPT